MFPKGKGTGNQAYPKLEELLKSTRIIDMETEYLVYYSQTEVEIVANMAKLLRAQKRYEEGIKLIETVLRQMSRSTVSFEYQWNGVGFAIRILSDLYFSIGKYEWSAELMEYVYKIEIKLRSGGNLPTILDCIADNLEHMEKRHKEYKNLYHQTFYVADFFENQIIRQLAKSYYEENFENQYNWY